MRGMVPRSTSGAVRGDERLKGDWRREDKAAELLDVNSCIWYEFCGAGSATVR